MKIRIKNDPKRAIISAADEVEPSDEIKLRMIAWLVFDIARKFRVDEIELAHEDGDADE